MRKNVINHDILIVLIDINPFQVDPDEITEAAPQELIVDEDEDGGSDIDID